MKTVILQKHQTLLDIAIQYCGSADALYEIATLNGVEITDTIAPGTTIKVPEVPPENEVINKRIRVYKNKGLKPVTGPLYTTVEAPEGLEYWYIESDFIIS